MILALLLVLAQDAPAPPDPGVPPTELGETVLADSDVVVVARVLETDEVGPASAVVRVRVVERMLGTAVAPDDELLVFAYPGELLADATDLLFLRRSESGARYELVHLLAGRDEAFEQKLRVARRTIWLAEMEDRGERDRATVALLLELASSEESWTRAYAAAELRYAAIRRPAAFTADQRTRMRRAASAPGARDVARVLLEAADLAEAGSPPLFEPEGGEQSETP